MEQIINAIEATNATVDQLVQQGNELCDDVDNLRVEDERLSREVAAIRSDVAANKGTIAAQSVAIQLNNEAIEGIRSDIAALDARLAKIEQQINDIAALDARVAKIEQQINDIAKLQNDLAHIIEAMHATSEAQAKAISATNAAVLEVAEGATPDMAALIARIPKPDAVRTRASVGAPAVVQKDVEAPTKDVEAPAVVRKDAAVPKPAVRKDAAPSEPAAVPKPAAKPVRAQRTAVETRAYARQYMIENGAKVEQLRDPAAIEATVASDAFAAWLAAR